MQRTECLGVSLGVLTDKVKKILVVSMTNG